jgi:hypothetical protein
MRGSRRGSASVHAGRRHRSSRTGNGNESFHARFRHRADWHFKATDGSHIMMTGAMRGGVWREKIELAAPGKPARLLVERVLKRVDS